MGLRIVQIEEASIRSGDFGAEVRGNTLALPKKVIDFARLMGESESDGLLEAMVSFHGNLEAILKWGNDERRSAIHGLLNQLNGQVSTETRTFIERMLREEIPS